MHDLSLNKVTSSSVNKVHDVIYEHVNLVICEQNTLRYLWTRSMTSSVNEKHDVIYKQDTPIQHFTNLAGNKLLVSAAL